VTELFHQLLDWVSLHPLWAGLIIFLVAMAESIAIIGILVPGVIIMLGIGALIAAGAIEFWSAFVWAVSGAIVGDGFSFWLGRRLRGRAARLWPLSRHPETLQRGIDFFRRYGVKSVAFGRFFGPIRAVVPLVAGMMEMPPSRYILANVLSALVWAPAYLLPGIVLGASLELASQVAFRLVILILGLVLLIWLMIWLIRLIFRLVHPHASAWLQALLNWSQLHPAFTEIAEALANPRHPEARGLAILTSLLILAVGLFALVLGITLEGSALAGAEHMIFQTIQSLRTPWADYLMIYFTRFGDLAVIITLILGVLLFLGWQRHWRSSLYWLSAAGFGLFASVALKYGLQIPRPPAAIEGLSSYSFPSSHVLRATVLYGFLSVIIARAIRPNWRWLAYSAAGVLILLVAVSRLYLGAHWLSDILGSLTLGLIWIALLGIAYHRHTQVESHWLGLSFFSLVLITGVIATLGVQRQEADLARYSPPAAVSQMAMSEWWEQGWSGLPQARKDTRNSYDHPLSVQYAGSLEEIQSHLSAKGWRPATMLSLDNTLKLLSPGSELTELPLLPQVHDGGHESLVLIKEQPAQQPVLLRLWPAQVELLPGRQPLWVGNVSEIEKSTVLDFFAFPETGADFRGPFRLLLEESQDLQQRQPTDQRDLLLLRTPNPSAP
jgi:undecaprenyl-diphosphatase